MGLHYLLYLTQVLPVQIRFLAMVVAFLQVSGLPLIQQLEQLYILISQARGLMLTHGQPTLQVQL